MQVWNRIPNSETLLIQYDSGENLKCNDVRFVFVKIDTDTEKISSVLILTSDYIVKQFGNFGVPTVKHQLLISGKIRKDIYQSKDKIIFYEDTCNFKASTTSKYFKPTSKIIDKPKRNEIFSLDLIKDLVLDNLIGYKIPANSTKNRGQELRKKSFGIIRIRNRRGRIFTIRWIS